MSPTLRHRSSLTGSEVWEGDAREVAAAMAPGSCSLAILDGPYAMQKAAWDRLKVADLPEWYRPHLEDVDRVCGPSASLYFWNTAEGWAAVHPVILSMGWTFRALVVWDKVNSPAFIGKRSVKTWVSVHEVCGFYRRGEPSFMVPQEATGGDVWRFPATGYNHERMRTGASVQRVRGRNPEPEQLHPCQKPLEFAERMIRASTRPGESVWAPFGGTLREAVAAERIARADPSEARLVITAELNQDGRDYIGPALRQLQGLGTRRVDPRQALLFGGAV